MFDLILKQVFDKEDRKVLHEIKSNQFFIIKQNQAMSKLYADLKASIDAVKLDLSDIKTKVGTLIDKLPAEGESMTPEEVADLKTELTDIHNVGSQVETNLDNALSEPVETPPVDEPPVETPPVETPPVENPPVETPPSEEPVV